jgi:D-alanine transaminase
MYSPAVGPCSAAICIYPLSSFVCLARDANASATQYTFIVSTSPTSNAGQLSATTSLGAANNIATVKAILTISHRKNPNTDAKISVMDRGFIFGDGVYEVVPVYGGQPFRLAQHMTRLERSLTEMRIPNPLTPVQWSQLVSNLIACYADSTGASVESTNQLVYIQITRGVALRDHAMPKDLQPTVFAMSNRMTQPTAEQRALGVACVTADDFRWQKAHIKSTSLLGSVFARQISVDAGAVETVMFRDGYLSEAAPATSGSSSMAPSSGSPRDNLVLEGIRYGLIEDLPGTRHTLDAAAHQPRRSAGADELLLSSATKEVLPVTTLDGKPGGQRPARSGVPRVIRWLPGSQGTAATTPTFAL